MYIHESIMDLNAFEDAVEVSPRELYSRYGARSIGKPDFQSQELDENLIPIVDTNSIKEQIRQKNLNMKESMKKAVKYFSDKTGEEFPDLLSQIDDLF